MTREAADKIIAAAEDLGVEVELRPGYSGRGMYGRTTIGVVGSMANINQAVVYAAYLIGKDEADDEDNSGLLKEFAFTWDSMGRTDIIAY